MQALFHAAGEQPEPDRAAFVRTACGGDGELEAQVLAMLDEDAHGGSLLERDVAQLADQVLHHAPAESRFGPYRLLHVLGEGGMGVVYLARREDLGSVAAIKILRDAWMSPARRERFASEQRTLAQLNHASIARLFDAGTLADGTPWIVMEYVEGEPITAYCRQHALPVDDRLKLFRAVCEAVEYAHHHAVIHRDLKPSNILVKADRGVRLLDFGIAKHLDATGTPADHTRTGLRLMTPAYAAPEQIRGEIAGMQTDVYALGVLLYEVLAGRLPYDPAERSAGEFEKMILETEPDAPSASLTRSAGASKAAWADLDVLCLAAMHKDPARRYRSVEALLRDVDHFLAGEPLDARPDTWRYRAAKFVRRNRRAVGTASLALALVVALIIFFLVRLTNARNLALAQAARTQRIQRFMLNLFDGGDKSAGPAADLRVLTLLDRGVQEAHSLDRDAAVQAELYQTLGGIYQKLGQFDQADSLLRSALEQRRRLLGPDHPDFADSEIRLGLLRADQAKLVEAERLVREGLAKTTRLRPPDPAAVAAATLALGQVLEAKGAYTEGIAVMEPSVRAMDKPGVVTPELADALGELANHHFYLGHYDTFDTLNQRVLAMDRQIYGDAHPKVAQVLINLGVTQHERGHYREAERIHREALAINEKFYGPDHPATASSLTLVARALVYENRYDEARELLQRALAIQERVHGPVHPAVASALNDLGNIASRRDRYAEAEAAFQRMGDIYRTVYHDRHYLIGIAQSNLATVYMNQKQYDRAEGLYRDAIRRFTDTQSADHMNTAIARIKLGRLLLCERRFADAEKESLAGYRILSKQASPSVSWLKNARTDLAAIYVALNEPAKAKQIQAEGAK